MSDFADSYKDAKNNITSISNEFSPMVNDIVSVSKRISDILDYVLNYKDKKFISENIKPALITAPVIIEDTIHNEHVTMHIIKNLFNIYSSYIIVSLNLGRYITESSTVRDMMSKVSSTESMYIGSDDLKYLMK